jgi:pretoxin HINT domain-containing protein
MAYAAELSGQPAVRDALVEEALNQDSDNEKARWLAGHVQDGNGWTSASMAEQSRTKDEFLQEYIQRRETCKEDAASRFRLANWCRDHDMPDRERLHLTELVNSHGPSPAVMSRLGMIKFRGQWIAEETLDESRRLDERQRRIEKKWKPVFAKWKGDLKAADAAAYAKLADRLATVNEAEAVPILEEVISAHNERAALAVVGRLDALPGQEATESLVRHAVLTQSEAVRNVAAEALKKRPKYNFIPLLLNALVAPMEMVVEYPYGNTGYRRTTTIQPGPDYDVKTVSNVSDYRTHIRDHVVLPGKIIQETNPWAKPVWRRKVWTNTTSIDDTPHRYMEKGTERLQYNEAIFRTLYLLSGEYYDKPEEWRDWWNRYTEYERDEDKPTYERRFHRHFWAHYHRIHVTRVSCLACGTPVATETGSRPIEQILPGDKVLAQDPGTGQLEYKVVLQRTVRQLGEMRKVSVGDDSVTVTLGHPFWVVGKGWLMAKELEVGQRVRGLGNSFEITAIEELPEDVAYNLVVDDFATYFAGDARLLLHDNTLPAPTDAVLPGFVANTR